MTGDGHYSQRTHRWHSRRWWWGHHDNRDAAGSYDDTANIGKTHMRRYDGHQAQRALRRQQRAEHAAANRARREKRRAGYRAPKRTREQMREETRLAQHAQNERRDARGGYKTENETFYGSDKHAAGDVTEHRITHAGADREARAQREHDREERERWQAEKASRRKTHPYTRSRKKAA